MRMESHGESVTGPEVEGGTPRPLEAGSGQMAPAQSRPADTLI